MNAPLLAILATAPPHPEGGRNGVFTHPGAPGAETDAAGVTWAPLEPGGRYLLAIQRTRARGTVGDRVERHRHQQRWIPQLGAYRHRCPRCRSDWILDPALLDRGIPPRPEPTEQLV